MSSLKNKLSLKTFGLVYPFECPGSPYSFFKIHTLSINLRMNMKCMRD